MPTVQPGANCRCYTSTSKFDRDAGGPGHKFREVSKKADTPWSRISFTTSGLTSRLDFPRYFPILRFHNTLSRCPRNRQQLTLCGAATRPTTKLLKPAMNCVAELRIQTALIGRSASSHRTGNLALAVPKARTRRNSFSSHGHAGELFIF